MTKKNTKWKAHKSCGILSLTDGSSQTMVDSGVLDIQVQVMTLKKY